MTRLESSARLGEWKKSETYSELTLPTLKGAVQFDALSAGVDQLVIGEGKVQGQTLGVSTGSDAKVIETLVRGGDLVVTCAATTPQPFQWQAYWRASSPAEDCAQVDLMVSLQTPTLESYPSFQTQSSFKATEAYGLSLHDREPQLLGSLPDEPVCREHSHCVILRDPNSKWSYLEMSLPEDQAITNLTSTNDGLRSIERKLGGGFLERGVIRRMCLRSMFLPRENDLASAAANFQEFCAEEPPLTT